MKRRTFISLASIMGLAPGISAQLISKPGIKFPVRAITSPPRYHWFGYYDKWQFDISDRYVLSNQVRFEHRSPEASDEIIVGMIDLENNDKWIDLGKSLAWGWQQGCMLQWIPGKRQEVIWNDRKNGEFISHIINIESGRQRTLPLPVYALSPDGKLAIGTDFSRIQHFRPGYGYQGGSDPFRGEGSPENSGIYKMDLSTGESALIVRLSDIADIPHNGETLSDKWHYFNHLLVSPDSKRFIFLHRWRQQNSSAGRFTTRMFTVNRDGSGLYLLDPSGYTSHFIWRDPGHITAWTRPGSDPEGFYVFKDRTSEFEPVGKGVMMYNGHNTYLPDTDNDWILNDTYPLGENREQSPYLFHVPSSKKIELGKFHSPETYRGEWRCDTHPRSNRSGSKICIDSAHGGNGRQLYLIDIAGVTG